jgi:hypothetical protein
VLWCVFVCLCVCVCVCVFYVHADSGVLGQEWGGCAWG